MISFPLSLPAGGSTHAGAAPGDGPLDLFVRPEDLRLGTGGWPATIVASQRSGPRLRLRARLEEGEGQEVELELPVDAERVHPPGSRVDVLPVRFGAFPAA